MPTLSPQEGAQRWVNSAGAASQRYVEGAQRTDKDPTALAAAAGQKLLNNFTQAVTSGRWQRNLQASGRAGWLAGITAKGAQNYATGVAAGQGAYQAAANVWYPIISNIQAQIEQMPNNTIEDAKARAARFIDLMHQAKLGM